MRRWIAFNYFPSNYFPLYTKGDHENKCFRGEKYFFRVLLRYISSWMVELTAENASSMYPRLERYKRWLGQPLENYTWSFSIGSCSSCTKFNGKILVLLTRKEYFLYSLFHSFSYYHHSTCELITIGDVPEKFQWILTQ